MCGVFGFVGKLTRQEWQTAHGLLVELAVASEKRGTDAAGFAALTSRGELLWQRQPGAAGALFRRRYFAVLRGRNVTMAIGHARLATTGAPAVNGNNHPHVAGDWALVHNGFIPLHERKAAVLGLSLRSQCDSEVLVQALARYGEAEGPEVCLVLGGKQSVLAWTNGEMPLVAFRVDGIPGLWWASTQEIAQEALDAVGLQARFASARPSIVYRMEISDGQVVIETRRAEAVKQ